MTPPLHLTIRFSTSLPDLELDIPSPTTTTVLALKHLLRTRISTRARLRLIYQGRLLPDPSALSTVFRAALAAAARRKSVDDGDDPKGKGKGKAVERAVRIYVNCSIAEDELSEEDLDLEAEEALKPPDTAADDVAGAQPVPSTRPRPRGFDRLLASGFTQGEIATLRTQFASIHADRFPPDAPPSPDALRSLEDSWIDSNAGVGGADVPVMGGGGGLGDDDPSGLGQGLETFIRSMMVGFFFPLGTMTWLLRQPGIMGDRWTIFVAAGVVLSLVTGTIMTISGGR